MASTSGHASSAGKPTVNKVLPASSLVSSSSATGASGERLKFHVPLRQGADPDVKDASHMAKNFEAEYVARYLESVGAGTTKVTTAYVNKHCPFKAAKLKTNLRANGAVADELSIEAPQLQQTVRVGAGRARPMDVYNTGTLMDVPESPQLVTPAGSKEVFANVHGNKDEVRMGGQDEDENMFAKYALKFCFPFNKLARDRLERMKAFEKKSNSGDDKTRKLAIHRELARGLRRPQATYMRDTLNAFETHLQQWVKGLKPNALKGRVTRAEIEETSALLRHEHTAALFDNVADFLYASVVAPVSNSYNSHANAGTEESEERQRSRMLLIQQGAAALERRCRESRGLLFFAYPSILVCLRAAIEMLFNAAFPLFFDSPDGATALYKMHDCITSAFDANGYFESVPTIQSDSQSMRALSKLGRRAHQPPRAHFGDVSAALRTAMGTPMSANARVMMSNGVDGARLTLMKSTRTAESSVVYESARHSLTKVHRLRLFSEATGRGPATVPKLGRNTKKT
ncbi:hypothetical protein RI054_08g44650 [Pseudoscourfieldia marina]